MHLTPEQIEKAVGWWADRICSPRFSGLSSAERMDPSNNGYQIAEMLMAAQVEPVTSDEREAFKAVLREVLSGDVDPWELGVDYHPTQTLVNAARKSGVSISNFPIKTHMTFRQDGTVIAVCEYGTLHEVL